MRGPVRNYTTLTREHSDLLHDTLSVVAVVVVVVDRGQPPDRLYGDRVNYQDCDQRS